jgi:hypothetical protein
LGHAVCREINLKSKRLKAPDINNCDALFGWTGAAGMFGAMVFLVADALLFFTMSGERDIPTIMSQLPLWRLYFGGALGLVGSWLYTLGTLQIYLAVKPAGSGGRAVSLERLPR